MSISFAIGAFFPLYPSILPLYLYVKNLFFIGVLNCIVRKNTMPRYRSIWVVDFRHIFLRQWSIYIDYLKFIWLCPDAVLRSLEHFLEAVEESGFRHDSVTASVYCAHCPSS